MASSDGQTGMAGVLQLLLASAAVLSAVGGSGKIFRDTIPVGVSLPAVSIAKSGFKPGTRPQRQGGNNTQIWSIGTITVSVATTPNYSGSLVRALLTALDNQAEVTVTGLGQLYSLRYTDDYDEPVEVGNTVWKLTRINLECWAKAT